MNEPTPLDALARRERARVAAQQLSKVEEQITERKRLLTAIADAKEPEPPPVVKKDPEDEFTEYVNEKWFQQLVPLRTQCFRCRTDSPVVYAPNGTIAFGGPVHRNDRDVTEAVIIAFEKIGWKFQKRKSYCPACRGLGAIT